MKNSKHRVLITNDDGIHAEGIHLLEKLAREFCDDVWVVAPLEERSGASHSISMNDPIRVRRLDERHFAVKGTPTDCVLLGIYELMPERPTLILSGINWGANLAEDLSYSGTAAAAMEGAILGIPSIALSQVHTFGHVHWNTAETFCPEILENILTVGIQPGTFVNVNFPPVAPENVNGIRVVRQGLRPPGSFTPERREDARTKPYYWIAITYKNGNEEPGTDLRAIIDNEIAITPVQLDMTAERMKEKLERVFKI